MDKSLFSHNYERFRRILRDERKRVKCTQVELAIRLEATQSFVSKVERGERRLDVIELRTWCHALGVSFSAFVSRLDRTLSETK